MATKKKPKQHSIVVETRPVPKGRPRLGRRGRVFTPEKTLQAEALIRGSWDGPVFEGPVWVTIMFSTTEIHITVGESLDSPTSKLRGDVDNYVKTVMDGLNGAAWIDDKQVHHIEATKS